MKYRDLLGRAQERLASRIEDAAIEKIVDRLLKEEVRHNTNAHIDRQEASDFEKMLDGEIGVPANMADGSRSKDLWGPGIDKIGPGKPPQNY